MVTWFEQVFFSPFNYIPQLRTGNFDFNRGVIKFIMRCELVVTVDGPGEASCTVHQIKKIREMHDNEGPLCAALKRFRHTLNPNY